MKTHLPCSRLLQALSAALALGAVASPCRATTFTVTNTDPSGAGSLQQAMLDANVAAGPPHTIVFNIPGIVAPNPAIIRVTSFLPALTQSVTIDGTTQPDTNTGNIIAGGQILGVGADGIPDSGDEPTLPAIPKPDVVLEYARPTGNVGLIIVASNTPSVVLKGLGLRIGATDAHGDAGSNNGVFVGAGASVTMDRMWFGSSQGSATDLSDPGLAARRLDNGILLASNVGAWSVTRSVLVNQGSSGATSFGATGPATFSQNHLGPSGLNASNNSEPISLRGTLAGATHTFTQNHFNNTHRSGGLDLHASQATITDNTFFQNYDTLQTNVDEIGSIVLRGGSDGGVIRHNLIHNSGFASGIVVQGNAYDGGAARYVISQNSIHGNGQSVAADRPGIDLYPAGSSTTPGVSPNDGLLDSPGALSATTPRAGNLGMDYPVFTSVVMNGRQLMLSGFVGTPALSTPFAGSTIEVFAADNSPANQNGQVVVGDGLSVPHGEGRVYLGTLTADAHGKFAGTLPLSPAAIAAWTTFLGHAPTAGDPITSTATLASAGTSEFGANRLLAIVMPVTENATVPAGVATAGALANVRSNDNIDGAMATAANSTIALLASSSPGITLNATTGAVDVAASVAPGLYTLSYQLCDLAMPTPNCAQVTDNIVVTPNIVGVTESGNGSAGVAMPGVIANVRSNDIINGAPASAANSTIAQISSTSPGITLDTTTGAVDVAAGLAAGNHTLVYQLCDLAIPRPNCTNVTDTVVLSTPPPPPSVIVGTADSGSGTAGLATAGVIGNVRSNDTINGAPATAANSTIAFVSSTSPGLTLDPTSGAVDAAAGVAAGTHTLVYRLCDLATPTPACINVNATVVLNAPPGATSIPTLGEYATALLALLLGAAGWRGARRRNDA